LLFAPTTEKLDPPQQRGPRSYAALCAASSKPQTPLSGAANVCRYLLSAHGQHLHQNDIAKGAIQFIVGEACRGEAAGAAATPGRSEPCFAYRTSRFCFLRRPIFLPNKISCKDKKTTARLSRLFKNRSSLPVSDLIGETLSS
jgi:hypothetical protein